MTPPKGNGKPKPRKKAGKKKAAAPPSGNGVEPDKGGRPMIVLTPEQVTEVETLACVLTEAGIADYLGMAERTFRNIKTRDDRVNAAYKKGRAKTELMVGTRLLNAVRNNNITAMIFWLKTQAGWVETAKHEHTGADGGPIAYELAQEARRDVLGSLARIAERVDAGADPRGLN